MKLENLCLNIYLPYFLINEDTLKSYKFYFQNILYKIEVHYCFVIQSCVYSGD